MPNTTAPETPLAETQAAGVQPPSAPAPGIMEHFAKIKDPRVIGRTEHKLFDILFIVIAAVIANCDDLEMIVLWAKERETWLRKYCELPNGIPTRFTISRLLRRLNPDELHIAFAAWMKDLLVILAGDIVAIDGKTMRRAYDRAPGGQGIIHMVSAWVTRNRVVLGQVKVGDKSNEIVAIPELLRLLEVKGALVTIDAIGCQKSIAADLLGRGADYLLAVKENQRTLAEDIWRTFDEAEAEQLGYAVTLDEGHGRVELREYYQCVDLSKVSRAKEWVGLRSLGKVVSRRCVVGERSTVETRYYISSLGCGAERMAHGIRSHWGIENGLHYVLDVSFSEDRLRVRKDHSPENLGIVRHVASNYVNQAAHLGYGIKKRRQLAALSTEVLQSILRI